VDVLTFRASERNLNAARQAARDKKYDEAIRDYEALIASSPDSPFLYRELAAVERVSGGADSALEHLSRAIELDPADAASLAQTGEILEGRGNFTAALSAYDRSLAIDGNAAVKAKRDHASTAADLARLPEQYRAIGGAPQVTRADLAALIGVRLGPVLRRTQRQDASVVTDVRNHWAERWIMAVVAAGVMDPFANHTFQPRAVVHRVDLADAVNHLLTTIAAPADVQQWKSRSTRFPDLAGSHLAYPAASLAVASGVMAAASDGSFQPSQSVTGADAVAAIERLRMMAGLASPQ
jgi:tetratricopeptide (TPR) repeat protein